MFFDRLVRGIFISLFIIIVSINIYYWSIAIQMGTENEVSYVGFYTFFTAFEQMPTFENVSRSVQVFIDVMSTFDAGLLAWDIATLGVSFIARVIFYLIQILVCVGVDLVRYFIWMFNFLGIHYDLSGFEVPLL